MRKYQRVSNSELQELLNKMQDYECCECTEGCLLDSAIYAATNKRGCEMTIAAFETYLNEWSSAYTVYIAVTEGDVKKLWNKWYEFVEANEQNEEETITL